MPMFCNMKTLELEWKATQSFFSAFSSSGVMLVISVSEEELRERHLLCLSPKHCSQYFTYTILSKALKIVLGSFPWSLGICK